MKRLPLLAAAAVLLAACQARAAEPNYTVNFDPAGALLDGDMVYLVNYDNKEKVDSAVVADAVAIFRGTVDTALPVMIVSDGNALGMLFLEQGEITVADEVASGTQLNDKYNDIQAQLAALVADFNTAPNDSLKEVAYNAYNDAVDKIMFDNLDNPIGYIFFSERCYDLTPDEFNKAIKEHPSLMTYERVNKEAPAVFAAREATAVGKQYTDFTIDNSEITALGVPASQSLSELIENGKYTLIDMWASWCGPCRREGVKVKELYKKYHDKGLNVVGIAVWDKPEATVGAIEELKYPWPQIINAQKVPTDLYGVRGIPFIALIGPDGTIVARDLFGDDLVNTVEAVMTPAQ